MVAHLRRPLLRVVGMLREVFLAVAVTVVVCIASVVEISVLRILLLTVLATVLLDDTGGCLYPK